MPKQRESLHAPENDTLVRRLGLVKLRELRVAGLSYRGIGRRYGAPKGGGTVGASGFEFRLSPERLLRTSAAPAEQQAFASALDLVPDGLAFFDLKQTLILANRPLRCALEAGLEGERLHEESASSCVRLRSWSADLGHEEVLQVLKAKHTQVSSHGV